MAQVDPRPHDVDIRVVVVGDSGTGKSVLFAMLITYLLQMSERDEKLIEDEGTGLRRRDIYVKLGRAVAHFALLDIKGGTEGQDLERHLQNATIAVICFCMNDTRTFLHVKEHWLPMAQRELPVGCRKNIIIAGCKDDLKFRKAHLVDKAQALAAEHGLQFATSGAQTVSRSATAPNCVCHYVFQTAVQHLMQRGHNHILPMITPYSVPLELRIGVRKMRNSEELDLVGQEVRLTTALLSTPEGDIGTNDNPQSTYVRVQQQTAPRFDYFTNITVRPENVRGSTRLDQIEFTLWRKRSFVDAKVLTFTLQLGGMAANAKPWFRLLEAEPPGRQRPVQLEVAVGLNPPREHPVMFDDYTVFEGGLSSTPAPAASPRPGTPGASSSQRRPMPAAAAAGGGGVGAGAATGGGVGAAAAGGGGVSGAAAAPTQASPSSAMPAGCAPSPSLPRNRPFKMDVLPSQQSGTDVRARISENCRRFVQATLPLSPSDIMVGMPDPGELEAAYDCRVVEHKGRRVLVKRVPVQPVQATGTAGPLPSVDDAVREYIAVKDITHPNVQRALGVYTTPDFSRLGLVFEPAFGVFTQQLDSTEPLPKPHVLVFAEELYSALHCLHSNGRAHGNLTSDAVLLPFETDAPVILRLWNVGASLGRQQEARADLAVSTTWVWVSQAAKEACQKEDMRAAARLICQVLLWSKTPIPEADCLRRIRQLGVWSKLLQLLERSLGDDPSDVPTAGTAYRCVNQLRTAISSPACSVRLLGSATPTVGTARALARTPSAGTQPSSIFPDRSTPGADVAAAAEAAAAASGPPLRQRLGADRMAGSGEASDGAAVPTAAEAHRQRIQACLQRLGGMDWPWDDVCRRIPELADLESLCDPETPLTANMVTRVLRALVSRCPADGFFALRTEEDGLLLSYLAQTCPRPADFDQQQAAAAWRTVGGDVVARNAQLILLPLLSGTDSHWILPLVSRTQHEFAICVPCRITDDAPVDWQQVLGQHFKLFDARGDPFSFVGAIELAPDAPDDPGSRAVVFLGALLALLDVLASAGPLQGAAAAAAAVSVPCDPLVLRRNLLRLLMEFGV